MQQEILRALGIGRMAKVECRYITVAILNSQMPSVARRLKFFTHSLNQDPSPDHRVKPPTEATIKLRSYLRQNTSCEVHPRGKVAFLECKTDM